MPIELKKKTIIFVVIIILLAISLTLITKSAIISFQVLISLTILSYFYIRHYPAGNKKKEVIINKLALVMAIIYIMTLVIGGALELFLFSSIIMVVF